MLVFQELMCERNLQSIMHDIDIFGMAFKDYLEGETGGVIRVCTNISEDEELPVAYFFRSYDDMPEWEQMVIDRCVGSILDVGAGAGSHALELQARGHAVCALDRSPGAARVMQQRGIRDVVCDDFFRIRRKKFDTILFLMNGAGMAGTLERLHKLLTHAKKLLNSGGVIYLESTDLMYMYREEDGSAMIPMGLHYYGELKYRLSYRDLKAKPFPWLFVDPDNLEEIAGRCGLRSRIIYLGRDHNYLSEIRKESD